MSSVGPDFARGRGILFAIVGLIFVALGIGVTVSGALMVTIARKLMVFAVLGWNLSDGQEQWWDLRCVCW